jgi:hypothetical protein
LVERRQITVHFHWGLFTGIGRCRRAWPRSGQWRRPRRQK